MHYLSPEMRNIAQDVDFLRESSAALSRSLQQILFIGRNTGAVSYEKILEIAKRNGVLDMQRPRKS
jgi:hypothetical protein